MGEFKDLGYACPALAEECSEVIQIITKLYRFGGNWDEIPPGKDKTRWEQLEGEMNDLLHHWNTLKQDRWEKRWAFMSVWGFGKPQFRI